MKIVKIVALSCLATMLASPIIASATWSSTMADPKPEASSAGGAWEFDVDVADGKAIAVTFKQYNGTQAEYKVRNPDAMLFPVDPSKKPSKKLTAFSNFLVKALGVSPRKLQSAATGVRIGGTDYVSFSLNGLGFTYTAAGTYSITQRDEALEQTQGYLMSLTDDERESLSETLSATRTGRAGSASTEVSLSGSQARVLEADQTYTFTVSF